MSTVPEGMKVTIGRRLYSAGEELPKGYKEPPSMKRQRDKLAKAEKAAEPVKAEQEKK